MAKKTPKPQRYVLDTELTIYRVQETKDLLLAALAQAQELEVDLAGVTEIDGAGLQLLMALKQEASRQHKVLRCVSHSTEALEVIELCDLGGYFGDPIVLRSHAH